ncbi:MAG: YdcF family protein [Chloroflexota bacterium]
MSEQKRYDAIIIPGGGLTNKGNVPPWVIARLDCALNLYRGETIITLSAGTVHKANPLDDNGFQIFESVALARYLIQRGISEHKVLTETCSYDTIGNAYFCRVIHVDPARFHRLLVINSEFHMVRTEAIFRFVFTLDIPPNGYELDFESVPNIGIDDHSLAERVTREAQSLENWHEIEKNIQSMQSFHTWLFNEHGAYAMAVPPERVSGKTLNTY